MDVLALLDELDKQDQKKKPVDLKANTKRNAENRQSSHSRPQSRGPSLRAPSIKAPSIKAPSFKAPSFKAPSIKPSRQSSLSVKDDTAIRTALNAKPAALKLNRPTSLPNNDNTTIRPALSAKSSFYSDRPPSTRRISFLEPPQVTTHRLQIATKTESLSSGFPYDNRLFKYGVTAEEWNDFSRHIVEAAKVPLITHVPVLAWTWTFHKQKVTKGVKKQMLYESSDLMRELRRWNKLFKRQGFQARLELPNTEESERLKMEARERQIYGETKEDKERMKMENKRFRMIITPNTEKASSIYSRSSNLTRSVSGEGTVTTRQNIPVVPVVVPEEENVESEEVKKGGEQKEASDEPTGTNNEPKETEDVSKRTDNESKETGDIPKETDEVPKGIDDEPKETGDEPKETGDEPKETGDEPKETGDERKETGDERKETGDEPKDTSDELKSSDEETKAQLPSSAVA